ncbi:hypothetical protein [Candidatus Sulfurimonas baltica]|uniref:FtsK domain-containing protein n=1 Tax=Candidatus Sulfurimonas baltica TaxID=2740404 RepID=A0A7S7LXL2_9BACT|nr:hypothetical protein [Candidatus Sulfurimonas baltica]QOY52743.1 hypothetical protein HUE88_03395 [Candidatus Sulfurimonas baltica]
MANKEEEFITTDRLYEAGYFNKKGYLNKSLISKISFFSIIISFIFFNYIGISGYYLFLKEITFNEFINYSFQEEFIANSAVWWFEKAKNILVDKNITFIFINLISIMLPIIFIFKWINSIRKKAEVQSRLASNNLNQYFLYKNDKKNNSFTFKLIKGETVNFDGFNNIKNKENLCQFFGYSSMEAKRVEDNKVIIVFSNKFPAIDNEEVKELNKNIEQYAMAGYMTLGYSNISDEGAIEKKVGNLFIKYLPLSDLNIHIKLIGASGFGKSVNFATFLRNFINSFNEIDTLFIHDFKGIESSRIEKFIEQSSQKEELEKRIISSTTIDELEDILVKLKVVYEYRRVVMSENNWLNYKGGKIIVMIDEYNIGMSALESKNKFERKKGEQVERMIKDFSMLYRAMNMYLIIVGQSNQVQDNWSSTLNKQTSIGFLLKTSSYVANSFCSEAYEKGIDCSNFNKGEVLYYNANNSIYFKFLAAYLNENFLFDMGRINITQRKEIDNNMFKLAIQLKQKLKNENKVYYEKLLKAEEIKEADYKKQIDDFNETLTKNINEISNYKFLVKEKDNFKFLKEEEFEINEEEEYETDKPIEQLITETVEKEEIVVKIDINPDLRSLIKLHKQKKTNESIIEAQKIDNSKIESEFEEFSLESFEEKEKQEFEIQKLEDIKEKKEDMLFEELEQLINNNKNEDGTIHKIDDITNLLNDL